MRLLLDTHLLLWSLENSPKLRSAARALILDEANELYFSAISIAEIAVKFALGRPDIGTSAREIRRELLDNGYSELGLSGLHSETVETLPALHKDPFDRLLVAQALVEGLTLLTSDVVVAQYPGPVRKV
ncbi:MAG: type II toxin-antitoxin system VapC family toxin [Sphingomonas sp.]